MARTPLWRRLYDQAEQAVGPRLEAGVRTDTFATALAAVMQVRSQLDHRRSQLAGLLGRVAAPVLHLARLPAPADVARLREEVLRLERQLRELTRQVDEASAKGGAHGRSRKSGGSTRPGPR